MTFGPSIRRLWKARHGIIYQWTHCHTIKLVDILSLHRDIAAYGVLYSPDLYSDIPFFCATSTDPFID